MTGPAPNPITEQWEERRANGQRHVLVVGEKRQRQSHNRVDCPGMQTPVIHGRTHGQPRALGRIGLNAERRFIPARVVGDWLGNGPEHETDTHTCCKEHGKPRHRRKFWLGVHPADADFANGHEYKSKGDNDKNVGTDQEKPVKLCDGPPFGAVEELLRLSRENQRPDYKRNNDYCCNRKNWRV